MDVFKKNYYYVICLSIHTNYRKIRRYFKIWVEIYACNEKKVQYF